MTNNDFFEDKNKKDMDPNNQTEVDKIKLGDTEYSQEELDKLVGLGKQAQEFQSKWNTPLEGLYKGYTKTTQELSEIKNELQDLKTKQVETRVEQGEQLTPQEMRQRAIKEADELGLIHSGNVRDEVLKVLQARDLNNQIDNTVKEMAEKGLPQTTGDDLLDYMDKTGIKNPEKAYKDMFETQYDEWKERQLKSVQKPGLVTDTTSVAGKEPEAIAVTKDNFTELLTGVLARQN